MMMIRGPVACWLVLLVLPAFGQDPTPNDWLDRMAAVVDSTDFEGTVIRKRGGESQALRVIRKIVDGVVHEKLVSQEGNGLEIIRNGNEVYCILPDKRSVLVESWGEDVTLFSTLPSSDLRFGSEYDLSLVREERVAGRRAVLLAVRPHDAYRYGHRIWLDRETAFPLRTELVGGDGALLEQLKFADIRLNSPIEADSLEPSVDLQDFTWYPEPARAETTTIESNWFSEDLPPGFRQVMAASERLPGTESEVIHLMYSDGLASVSVFIAEQGDEQARPRGVLNGSSNSHSVVSDGYLITAIGEVPLSTARRIAVSTQRR
jgi:sigma-E factor negative regulatory protein RseB